MKCLKLKKFLTSIVIIILVFLTTTSNVYASFFDDDTDEESSSIEQTIDADDGGLFEKIIAKMIGGIAEGVFSLTTNEELGVGFKEYDELIFGNTDNDIAPFTDEQWTKIMGWYKVMTTIVGVPILIAVVVLAYKIIIGGFNIEKRNEAKDNILRLFFGAAAIALAPLFVKLVLYLNNNLVKILVLQANGGSLNDLLGNSILSNIRTGNAILTAIVIAMFAYLFAKLNIKFMIRHFTLLVFTIFTPVVATLWIMNRRAIGASLWFGEILVNAFMQFVYAFLFLVYLNFLPVSGGWAVSLIWALMILPLAEALLNVFHNLISRIAGVPAEEVAQRGIGMASNMGYTIKAFTYQFKNPGSNGDGNSSGLLANFLNKTSVVGNKETPTNTNPVQTNIAKTQPVKTKPIETNMANTNRVDQNNKKDNAKPINERSEPFRKKAVKAGKAFMNTGMYMAEGRNFNTDRRYNKNNRNRYDSKRKKDIANTTTTHIEMDDRNG